MADVEESHNTDVMIALLPTTKDWCKIKLPHLTLVFCGEIVDLMSTDENEMAKTCIMLSMRCKPVTLVVMGVDVFGDETKVDVLRLRPDPEIVAMQSAVKFWDASEHSFNPHCTVGPQGSADVIPDSLTFDRIALAWGDSLLEYKLLN